MHNKTDHDSNKKIIAPTVVNTQEGLLRIAKEIGIILGKFIKQQSPASRE